MRTGRITLQYKHRKVYININRDITCLENDSMDIEAWWSLPYALKQLQYRHNIRLLKYSFDNENS